jgi:hypothetical protein
MACGFMPARGNPGLICSRATVAPGWPGGSDTVANTRARADALNDIGIKHTVDHYPGLIETPQTLAIIVGHSFGGADRPGTLGQQDRGRGGGHRPRPHQGVKVLPFAQLKSAFPVPSDPANRHRTVSLTASDLRYRRRYCAAEGNKGGVHPVFKGTIRHRLSRGRRPRPFAHHRPWLQNVGDVVLQWLASKGL